METGVPVTLLPAGAEAIRRDFNQALAACTKQLDAFDLALQTALKLGAARGAVCVADPASGGKLVVRLSAGMEGASNKVLGASAPGRIAAWEAHTRSRAVIVDDYARSEYTPTDLEERLGVSCAAYFPLLSAEKAALGLLIAMPPPTMFFPAAILRGLEDIAVALGTNLYRFAASSPRVQPHIAAGMSGVPEELVTAFRTCLHTPHLGELSDRTLDYSRQFSGSPLGFVGYLDPTSGHLNCLTMTRDIFPRCQVAGKTVVFEKAGGLGGWVLDHRAPLIANEPATHPASVGTPPGHLPIDRFMGVPCLFQGNLMGMIALANKETDYGDDDLRIVEAFADIYAAAVARFVSERELTESRNRFSSLYQEAPCGYQTLAPDGRILELNDTLLQLLGRSRDEIIGKINVSDLLTSTGRALLAEQFRELQRGLPAAPVELHLKLADGSRLPVLHSVTGTLDDRGFLQQVRCTVVDIRPRKALRRTRDYLDVLFKASASPIIVWNPQLEITRVNGALAHLSGYAEEALIGRHLSVLFPEQERAMRLKQVEDTLHGSRLESAELPVRTRSGECKTVLWNSSNLYSEDGTELLSTVVQGVDITVRKLYEELLHKRNRALNTLSRANEALVHAVDEDGLLQQVCDVLVSVGGYRLAWIGYAEHDAEKTIRPVAVAGADADYVKQIKVTWDDSPTGKGPGGTAIRTGVPQVFQDILNDPRFDPWHAEARRRGYASNAAIPLKYNGKVLGNLALYGAQPNSFDADEMQLMIELANDLAFGITTLRTREQHSFLEQEREHHLQQMKESMEGAVQAIAATIEKRDPYTAGHQQRVARLAVAIAREMGLTPQRIEGVHFGSLIHDIGKISVPAEILNKPGRLEPIEFRIIQAHATAGKEILGGVKFPWPIVDMVHQHHERLDGSGYPLGLKGDQILLEARILAVADVVEAMSSFRPYRPAVGTGQAMEEITRNSGRLYDPEAVAACVRIMAQGFVLAP